jgi:hypothetical protein
MKKFKTLLKEPRSPIIDIIAEDYIREENPEWVSMRTPIGHLANVKKKNMSKFLSLGYTLEGPHKKGPTGAPDYEHMPQKGAMARPENPIAQKIAGDQQAAKSATKEPVPTGTHTKGDYNPQEWEKRQKEIMATGTPRYRNMGHSSIITPNALHVLHQKGMGVKSAIDSGTRGTAYELSDGRVLKATGDKSEAQSAALIKKNPSPYIFQPERVFELNGKEYKPGKTSPRNEAGQQYFILQKKLEPLEYLRKKHTEWNWNNIYKILEYELGHSIAKSITTSNVQDLPYDRPLEALQKIQDESDGKLEFDKFKKEITADKDTYINFWKPLLLGLLHLKKLGIKFSDAGEGNIMVDPESEKPVIIDIGYSKGRGENEKIPKLNEVFRIMLAND